MSLDVYLRRDTEAFAPAADFCEENGFPGAAAFLRGAVARPEELFSANITHNLNRMAEAAGVYEACWRPEEIGARLATHIIPLLRAGLVRLKSDPDKYRAFDAKNGWGTYEHFVPWLEKYLEACEANPDAVVSASR